MYKRPSNKDTDEDILQLQADFEQRKNTIQLAAKVAFKKAATPTANLNNLERNVPNKEDVKAVHNLLGKIVERTGSFHSKERKIQKTGFPVVNRHQIEVHRPTKSLQNPSVSNDMLDIHLENVEKLKKMTTKEIVEEKRSLEQKLSPEMIKFLKNRSKKVENNKILQINEQFELENYKNTGLDDVLSNKKPGSWLNSLVIEPDKLEWLKNTRKDVRKISENDEFEARFDLNGNLLPYQVEMTEENRQLFHHGEEPNRPGYSIKELLHLSRSTVLQQRITALTSLEKCLENYSIGLYDDIFELPIEQIFFVVRFSLDENNSIPVLEMSLAALRYLFFSEFDEKCLDNLYFIGMEIELPEYEYSLKSDKEYKEIDDQQLAEIDLIKCLVRSNIFTRFTYIINTLKPDNIETVLNCLKLLLRLVQDSDWVRKRLFDNQYLLGAVITNFIPKITSYSKRGPCYNYPMIEALKLVRILILKNPKEVAHLLSSSKIVSIITDYVLMDVEGNMYALLVQIEALGIWMALLKYWLYVEKFTEIQQLMLRIFNFHINNTNLNDNKSIIVQKHCIIAINVLILAYKTKHFETSKPIFLDLLKLAFSKWLNQLNQLDRFQTINFQLIIVLMNAVNELQLEGFSSFVKQLMSLESYHLILKEFLSCSNFLFQSDLKPHTTTATFSNLETICLDADNHLIAALRDSGYSQMFMKSLTKYLVNCTESPELIAQFLDNCSVKKYLKKFLNSSQLSLVSNWFTEILEKDVVFNVVLMLSKCSSNEAVLMTCKFLNCCKLKDPVMMEVLFNTVLFANHEMSAVKQFVIENLSDIQDCNKYYLNDNKSLAFDWMYKPLSCFLDENYDPITNTVLKQSKINVFSETLKWIIRLDNSLHNSTGVLPTITNRFCKFSQLFLSSPDIFLDKSINLDVTNVLRFILNQNEDLNFDEEIFGFGNFENLYKKLLEQYQSCSHCDKTFANIILMPLMQTQNVKWKKIFWFEYEIVSKLITINENELFVKLDRFLEPKEVDNSFKNYYKKILQDKVFRSRAPMLTKILTYHSATQ